MGAVHHPVEFRLLGPLDVLVAGEPVRPRGRKQLALLALLLVHANDLVPAERLIDALWGARPPETAANTLQVYVSQLRKLLGGAEQLSYRAPGYVLRVAPGQLDLGRFEALAADGRAALAAGDAERAAALLADALSLWRGSPLAEFAFDDWAQPEIVRLQELRLATIEARVEADLALGRHAAVAGELERLAAEHPKRERLSWLLMLALYRSGRQGDALQAYHDLRGALVEELGIDPGPELQHLERAILRQDPALAPPAPRAAAPAPGAREVRKTVTVVFSTLAVPDGVDPEVRQSVAERARAAVTAAIERHGGGVERLPGETVMGVLGIPTVHEDDPLRAVRALVEARAALDGLAVGATLRAGVATGEVIAGAAGPTGDAVTAAARLNDLAAPGEILLREETRLAVRSAVRVEPAQGGKPGWTLVELEADAPAIPRRLDTPIVGRSDELAELVRAFERCAREGAASLFTVLGPAGIGKSRLAHELAGELGESALVLSGRCLSYGEGVAFWPLADVVRQAVGDDVRAGLAALLADDARGEQAAAELEAALGLREAPGEAAETPWAVRRLLETLARRAPVLLALDDVHWAEPTFLDLLDEVVDWLRAPVLVLCLARPELLDVRPTWGGGRANASSLLLEPLSDADSARVVDNLGSFDEEVRARVTATAEGNPLFIEQMLAMLAEDTGRGRAVPATIQGLLAARLDLLPPAERHALDRASVVGREVARAALEHLTPDDERAELDAALRALVRKQLLAPEVLPVVGEEGLRFRHGLIRDAAYDSLPKRVRAELHERVAERLEGRAPDEVVGYHLEQAYGYGSELGAPDPSLAARAADHLAAAGHREYVRADMRRSAGLLERALALLPDDDARRPAVLVELTDALRECGDFGVARVLAEEALRLAPALGDAAAERFARTLQLRMRIQTDPDLPVEELLDRGLAAVRELEELGEEAALADAWSTLAWLPWISCHAVATEEMAERAIRLGNRSGARRAVLHGQNLLLGAALFGPAPADEAISRCERICEEADSERTRASAYRALAGLRAFRAEFEEARRLLEADQALIEQLGLRVAEAVAAEVWAMLGFLEGDAGLAEWKLESAVAVLEPIGETSGLSTTTALLAEALYRQGRYEAALEQTRASEAAAPLGDVAAQVQWRGARAKALAARGDAGRAEALAREAVVLAAGTDFVNLHAGALADLAVVVDAAGRPDDAAERASSALALYRRKGNVAAIAQLLERFPDAGS